MPKYIATGGPTGDGEIEVKGIVYKPGDQVELPSSDWLVKEGYVAPLGKPGNKKGDA